MENGHCCNFCAQIDCRIEDNLFSELLGPQIGFSYILEETANFVVMPAIGAFLPGYLLLIPRSHMLSFGHVALAHYSELRLLLKLVSRRLQALYGLPVIVFEHGPTSMERRGGNCTDHAHWHVVPVPGDVDLLGSMRRKFDVRKVYDMQELRNQVKRDIPYLLLKHLDGNYYICDALSVECQFFRRELARQLEMDEAWDWVSSPCSEQIVKTIQDYGQQLDP